MSSFAVDEVGNSVADALIDEDDVSSAPKLKEVRLHTLVEVGSYDATSGNRLVDRRFPFLADFAGLHNLLRKVSILLAIASSV